MRRRRIRFAVSIPALAQLEPVDRSGRRILSQRSIQLRKIEFPSLAIVVVREPGPILVAVVMQSRLDGPTLESITGPVILLEEKV